MSEQQQQRVERRLAAIFAADVAGYSRLISADESGTLKTFAAHRAIMDRLIAQHGGRIANTAGDSVLAEFPSAVDAVQCAVALQEKLAEANAGDPEDRRLQFRIGIHVGDVVVRGGDLLGDGVNVAARLEGLAEPGGIAISGTAHGYVRKALPLAYTDLGEQHVKNIDEPLRAFALRSRTPLDLVRDQQQRHQAPERPSLAVLPFTNISEHAEDDYLCDGITEDIITALTRVQWFHVVARNSVFGYKRGKQDARQVARDLGASYVLEGSVRKAGTRIRLTAQLIDGASGNHVWAKRYDRELQDIFAVQDDLTESIVASAVPEVGRAERERARRKHPENLTAWDCYQRGLWHLYKRTNKDGFTEAERLFERALELDPNFVSALCALSEAHALQLFFGYADNQETQREDAMRLARRAVTVDGEDALARCALARAHVAHREHEAAIPHAEAALVRSPTLAWARYLLGLCHVYSGRPREGIPHLEAAINLSPHDPYVHRYMACTAEAHLFLNEHEQAVEWASRALRQNSSAHWSGHTSAASALGHLGRSEEAGRILRDLLQHRPDFSVKLMRRSISLSHQKFLSHYLDGLRKAGLPE